MILSLRERKVNSAARWDSRCEKEETGLGAGLPGDGGFTLAARRATALYVLVVTISTLHVFRAGKYMLVWVEIRMAFLWSFGKWCVRTGNRSQSLLQPWGASLKPPSGWKVSLDVDDRL